MNKRLRKKKNWGEYRCWVFSVTCKTSHDMMTSICDWGDDNGFLIGGRVGGERLDFDVDRCHDKRCCFGKAHPFGAKEEDREIVQKWLESQGCTEVKCTQLWDGRYGTNPMDMKLKE